MNTIDVSMHAHNTRLQNRLADLQENRSLNANVSNNLGPAYNTRHTFVNIQPTIETSSQSKKELTVDIDFDEASREWNKNKRRCGQMYEYVSKPSPKKQSITNPHRYNTRSSNKSS